MGGSHGPRQFRWTIKHLQILQKLIIPHKYSILCSCVYATVFNSAVVYNMAHNFIMWCSSIYYSAVFNMLQIVMGVDKVQMVTCAKNYLRKKCSEEQVVTCVNNYRRRSAGSVGHTMTVGFL